MNKTKDVFVYGFAIFAAFFGAGNLILPPLLGFNSGPDWWLVAIGFVASATIIPFFALFAHARLQGTMIDFGNKVSPLFSLVFCLIVYTIAVTLPIPRTAATTHEMAIAPFFGTSSLLTSTLYFTLVFIFVLNRGNVLQILGKYLTPIIGIILLAIIIIGIFSPIDVVRTSTYETPVISGFMEGFQTYDALAGLLTGGIVIISLNLKGYTSFEQKREVIAKSGFVAMMGLFIIYWGLIYLGSSFNDLFPQDSTRIQLLTGLAGNTLGNIGTVFLSVLVALACFTTAVGVIVGTADFFKGLFKESQKAYLLTTIISCVIGIIIGQMDVKYIIDIALPVLRFIYPLAIVLIFLNVIHEKWASKKVFKSVVLVTFLFSIPDFMGFLVQADWLARVKEIVPFAQYELGWVLPAMLVFITTNMIVRKKIHD